MWLIPLAVLSASALIVVCLVVYVCLRSEIVPAARNRLFEVTSDGIIVLDGRGRVRYLNPAAQKILGVSPSAAVGQTSAKAFAAWPRLVALLVRAAHVSGEVSGDASGLQQHYEVRASPLTRRRLRGTGKVVTLRGVSDGKESHRQLLQGQRTISVLEARERLEGDVAEILLSRVQSRLQEAWQQLGECELMVETDWPKARTSIAAVKQDLDEIREREIRQVSHRLHPLVIRLGLLPALRILVSPYDEYFTLFLNVDPHLIKLDDPLKNQIPEPLRLAVYRIIEQALDNVRRHARAAKVDVSLEIDPSRRLTVAVRDDGSGFDPSAVGRGLGLDSIAGHVDRLGGEWKIETASGFGTTVTAILPLDYAAVAGPA